MTDTKRDENEKKNPDSKPGSNNATAQTGNGDQLSLLMGNTVNGITSTISTLYGALQTNMQKQMETTAMMNSMMEQYVRQGIKLSILISTNTTSPEKGAKSRPLDIEIGVKNTSFVALTNVKLEISFSPRNKKSDLGLTISAKKEDSKLFDSGPLALSEDTKKLNADSNKFDLPPNTEIKETYLLEISEPQQIDGQVSCVFPSPGAGNPLAVTHPFGVYMIYQYRRTKKSSNDKGNQDGGLDQNSEAKTITHEQNVTLSIPVIRDLFCLSLASGIEPGLEYLFEGSGGISLKIIDLTNNDSCAVCRLSCPTNENDTDLEVMELMRTFGTELAYLGNKH
ncbi:hypothetical protein H4219_001819 [Mycoemilia scoparia]|uniref:Uncharacterized protein n=1 Tax=Mycoemilia scoparia TaxID=417184 RepID=A0A9W8DV85_9FUNG|nr:hypothetical protein H4219_001819 [Mycoemilia scoparia]